MAEARSQDIVGTAMRIVKWANLPFQSSVET